MLEHVHIVFFYIFVLKQRSHYHLKAANKLLYSLAEKLPRYFQEQDNFAVVHVLIHYQVAELRVYHYFLYIIIKFLAKKKKW